MESGTLSARISKTILAGFDSTQHTTSLTQVSKSLPDNFQTMAIFIHSYLIADSDKYGKDQIISGTIKYPWDGCKVADDLCRSNERVVADALSFAENEGYNNIREVMCYFKEVLIPKWKMIDHRKTKEKIVRFDIHNLPIPEQSFLLKIAK